MILENKIRKWLYMLVNWIYFIVVFLCLAGVYLMLISISYGRLDS